MDIDVPSLPLSALTLHLASVVNAFGSSSLFFCSLPVKSVLEYGLVQTVPGSCLYDWYPVNSNLFQLYLLSF